MMTGENMLLRILLAALLAAPIAGWAAPRSMSTSSKKKAAAPKKEVDPAEESLGKALAGAINDSLEAMDGFRETAEELESRGISRAKALGLFGEDRDRLAKAIARGREADPADGAEAAKDSFLVVASQGLKGMDIYMEGVKEGEDDKQEKGERLGELAYADLESLLGFDSGAESSSGGPEIGSSVGFNGSAAFGAASTNGSLGLTFSRPLSESVDLGFGTTWGINGQETGPTSYSATMNLGGNVFMRKHFLGMIPDKPWVVPFLGIVGSMTLNMDIMADSMSTNTGYGAQLGVLVFSNRNTAVNFQLQWDTNASGSSSTTSTSAPSSSSTLTMSVGIRYML